VVGTALRLEFDTGLAEGYRSASQRARRLSEGWFGTCMYCASCGAAPLGSFANNARANDFFCNACGANFELKSGQRRFGPTVPDGAFATMIARLERQGGGPHLALLRYCPEALAVRDLFLVPACFLTRAMILPRKPLGEGARRAGWVGCNIRIADLPAAGRIAVVMDGTPLPKADVVRNVGRATAVEGNLAARTWLLETLRLVERLKAEFTLADLYAFEPELRGRFPENRNIRPKLRQQLQRLRDAGFLAFLGDGRYRRLSG
jgi:type II restriction enzyme